MNKISFFSIPIIVSSLVAGIASAEVVNIPAATGRTWFNNNQSYVDSTYTGNPYTSKCNGTHTVRSTVNVRVQVAGTQPTNVGPSTGGLQYFLSAMFQQCGVEIRTGKDIRW
jgi:hypothetical protein